MPKHTKHEHEAATGSQGPRTRRTLRRLERELAESRDKVARRTRKVEQAHAEDAPREVASRREQKLARARRRAAALEARIASLRPTRAVASGEAALDGASAAVAVAVTGEVRGYCLRDRMTVVIADPRFVPMRNGRNGVAGTCPACGARVVRPS
jgi:hypothetical protein